MNRLITIISPILLLVFSCQNTEYSRPKFILDHCKSVNLELRNTNKTTSSFLIKYDSSYQSIRESTDSLILRIDKLKKRLEIITNGAKSNKASSEIITRYMVDRENGDILKEIVNTYCSKMSKPRFKVWNIAKDAVDFESTLNDPDSPEFIPFAFYYFDGATITEAKIILTTIQNEILQVENRYYLHTMQKMVSASYP